MLLQVNFWFSVHLPLYGTGITFEVHFTNDARTAQSRWAPADKSRPSYTLTISGLAASYGSHSVRLAPSGNPKTGGKTTIRHDDSSGKHGFIRNNPPPGLPLARALSMLGYIGLHVTLDIKHLIGWIITTPVFPARSGWCKFCLAKHHILVACLRFESNANALGNSRKYSILPKSSMIEVDMESDCTMSNQIYRGFNSWFKTTFSRVKVVPWKVEKLTFRECFAWNRQREKKSARTILDMTVVTVNHFTGNNAH